MKFNLVTWLRRIVASEETIRRLSEQVDVLSRRVSVISGVIEAANEARNTGARPVLQNEDAMICLDESKFVGGVTENDEQVSHCGPINLTWNVDHWEGGSGNLVALEDMTDTPGASNETELALLDATKSVVKDGNGLGAYLANVLYPRVSSRTGNVYLMLDSGVLFSDDESTSVGNMVLKFMDDEGNNGKVYPVCVLKS